MSHDLLVSFLTCSAAWKRLSKPARAALEAAYDPDHQGIVDAHVHTLASLERHGFIHPDCRLTDAAREVVRWGGAPMSEHTWLGHRDLCPLAWGEPCTCPCSKPTCPGVDRCQDPECPVLQLFETTD